MADKIIKLRIDVKKLNKDYFFVGEKGTYADLTLLYNEKQDQYETNGMIVQDVPKAIYEKDKTIKGAILGNAKEWPKGSSGNRESVPAGPGNTAPAAGNKVDNDDDLPF